MKTDNKSVVKRKKGYRAQLKSDKQKPSVSDLTLNRVVEYYNSQLLFLNGVKTPTLSKDILAPTKRPLYTQTKYRKKL